MRRALDKVSPATIIGTLALVVAMSGAAYAGTKVSGADILRGAITAPKLATDSVITAKIRDDAVTGEKVNEATLGPVPSLEGRTTVFQPLSDGQSVVIAKYGLITLNANCAVNTAGNDDVSITARTAQDGAVMDGNDDHNGTDGAFLNVATLPGDAELVYNSTPTGTTNVDNDADEGFVVGPDGRGFSINGDEMRLGLNYLGATCFVSGILTQIG